MSKYDARYTTRLVNYVRAASARGIVVQVGLFCGYDASHEFIWAESPMNPANNVNSFSHGVNRTCAYTLSAPADYTEAQLQVVRHVVGILKPYDNVLVEIVFTPNGTTVDWARKVLGAVRDADPARLVVVPVPWLNALALAVPADARNLIANCGAGSNCSARDGGAGYSPPLATATAGLRPSILDSAGAGTGGAATTAQMAWRWAMEGGACVYNLDWSYTVGHEDGSNRDPQARSTTSGPAYRAPLRALSRFVARLDLAALRPSTGWLSSAAATAVYGLAPSAAAGDGQGGHVVQFAALLVGSPGKCVLNLRAHVSDNETCVAEWVRPATGVVAGRETLRSPVATIRAPDSSGGTEIALLVECQANA